MILNEEKIEKGGAVIENLLHESNNVIKTSYNYQTEQLFVTFHRGGVYNYNQVENDLYSEPKKAASVGTFINAHIKPSHSVRHVGTAPEKIMQDLKDKIQTLKSAL